MKKESDPECKVQSDSFSSQDAGTIDGNHEKSAEGAEENVQHIEVYSGYFLLNTPFSWICNG